MYDHSDGVMIALLPTVDDWCHIECPHLTLVYAGKKQDMSFMDYQALAKDAASIAMVAPRTSLQVTGRETFGDAQEAVDVFTLRPTPELLGMRNFVEKWNKSEYTEFKPHVTIGPVGTFVEIPPRIVSFDRVLVSWGDDQLTFNLRR